ncbi:MAG: hypothetical protein GWM92_07025, partial [Gemmatimonadetes bacterium]|nr:hypothetical protein [Gemmatimonadota bacterium]NIT86976.1 hypothetical protein [Gemmatimonadota bacterium]NIU77074.1 hypothetical protein [Gammaproteobacteria bacterium]NIX39231.1 hypothetical protein [Gemmatimonadota bacterium]NIY39198.1 hypothetical protein [Gemmatimonadota bacterium]
GSGIASWLGATDALPGEGERFRIRLDAGGTITGRVLRVTEHEAAITWDEVEGVLELKVCPGPDEVFVALRVSSWSREKDLAEERAVLSGALDRLLERARELTREPA